LRFLRRSSRDFIVSLLSYAVNVFEFSYKASCVVIANPCSTAYAMVSKPSIAMLEDIFFDSEIT